MADAREALDRLRAAAIDGRLDELCRRERVRLLGAFGSATRPSGPPPDDLDLAVSFLGSPRLLDLLAGLVDLAGTDALDLVVFDGAEPVLRSEALVGVPLYEHDAGVYATDQMAAWAVRYDTAWLRELDRRALAG